jgi:hypothetical protein
MCDPNNACKFLSSVRKDIKKIVLEHQVHDDEIANLSALPEEKLISTCSPDKAPTATPVEESEKQHTLNASTCGTSRTAGIMLALMHVLKRILFINLVILVRYNGTRKFSLKDRVIGSCKVPTQ